MNYRQTSKWKIFKKVISIITLHLFIISNISYAVTDISRNRDSKIEKSALAVDTLAIPRDYGSVKERSNGGNGKLVLYIQDAHCNYAAQHKIAEMLEYFSKEYGADTVNLEGGKGQYDLSAFTDIENKGVREKVADYFVREGLVSGSEYFTINNPNKLNLWGIENADLYFKNLNAYRESLGYSEIVDKYLKSLTRTINKLKLHIHSDHSNHQA